MKSVFWCIVSVQRNSFYSEVLLPFSFRPCPWIPCLFHFQFNRVQIVNSVWIWSHSEREKKKRKKNMHITDTYQINTVQSKKEIKRLKNEGRKKKKQRNRSWSNQAVSRQKLDWFWRLSSGAVQYSDVVQWFSIQSLHCHQPAFLRLFLTFPAQ